MEKRAYRPKPVLLAVLAAAVLATAAILWMVAGQGAQAPRASDALLRAASGLDEIHIQAYWNAEDHSMTVQQTLQLISRSQETRDAVVLRTWPNAFQNPATSPIAGNSDACPDGFSAGSLVMEQAQLTQSGQEAEAAYRYLDEAKTVLSLPLEKPWQPGETIEVSLIYTVHFPHARYRFGWWEDAVMAGQSFVQPAMWQEGAYRTDAYLPIGDPLSGECANYHLQLTVPKGYDCAVTGSIGAVKIDAQDQRQYTIEAPCVRELGLVIQQEPKWAKRLMDGALVQACAPTQAEARQLLKAATAALECFSQQYGKYPYPTYTVSAVPMGVGGAEYPGMVMVAQELLAEGGEPLEYAVTHETAHQWWYALVGSDSSTHPWMDEALCEFSLLEYVERRQGKVAREQLRQTRVETAMQVTVAGQATPGAPLSYFETNTDYMVLVYGRATSLLCAMDDWLEGGLADVLRRYAEENAFGIADRESFTAFLRQETGVDLEPLMVDYLDTYILH